METGLIERFRLRRISVPVLLFIAYVGYYLCRVSYLVAMPELESEFEMSKQDTGAILSVYAGVYAVSKLLNGWLGDRIGGKAMLLLGLVGTAFCNIVFGFGSELAVFMLIWAVNAYFQSAGWPGLIATTSQWCSSRESGRTMGVLSLTYQLGDVLARLLAGALIAVVSWQGMFWVHAALLLVVGLLVWKKLSPTPAAEGLPDVSDYARATDDVAPPEVATASSYGTQLRAMVHSRAFWFLCLTYLLISILRYGFMTWSVGYLKENGGMDTGTAAMTSAVYPLCGAFGTLAVGWASDRLQARRGPVVIAGCVLLCPAVYLFGQVPPDSTYMLVSMLGVVGFLIYGPYSLMAGAMAIDLGSRHSASTAAGILDAIGALGVVVAGYAAGGIIDVEGWAAANEIVVYIALATAIASLGLWGFKPLRV